MEPKNLHKERVVHGVAGVFRKSARLKRVEMCIAALIALTALLSLMPTSGWSRGSRIDDYADAYMNINDAIIDMSAGAESLLERKRSEAISNFESAFINASKARVYFSKFPNDRESRMAGIVAQILMEESASVLKKLGKLR